jgi:hypothetical protein
MEAFPAHCDEAKVKFITEFVARTSVPVPRGSRPDHEIGNDTMERQPVIEGLSGLGSEHGP